MIAWDGPGDNPRPTNGTSKYDGNNWTQVATDRPAERIGHGMAYDRRRGVAVLYGGDVGAGPSADTCEWDGVSWQFRPEALPVQQVDHTMVYDESEQRLIVAGDGTWGFEREIAADLDGDHDVDVKNFSLFTTCVSGSNLSPVERCPDFVEADFDGDGDVDEADFLLLAQSLTGGL